MLNIFKRLSRKQNRLNDLLKAYIDTVHFDELVSAYESLLYDDSQSADMDISELKLSSRRYTYLLKKSIPVQVLLSAGGSLLPLLESLAFIERDISRKADRYQRLHRWLGYFVDFHPASYQQAAGKVRAIYHELLKESSLLAAILAERLRHWYCNSAPAAGTPVMLSFIGAKRRYHDSQQSEVCFYESCSTLLHVHRAHQAWQGLMRYTQKTELSHQSIEGHVAAFIVEKHTAITKSLEPLNLSWSELVVLEKKRLSFWKAERAQASLRFIELDVKRQLQAVRQTDFRQQWGIIQSALAETEKVRVRLNAWFHRQTRAAIRHYQVSLEEKRKLIAMQGFRHYISAIAAASDSAQFMAAIQENTQVLDAWLETASPGLLNSWRIVYEGLMYPDRFSGLRWVTQLRAICEAIGFDALKQDALIVNLVKRYLVPVVKDSFHPAYSLVYAYAKSQAYLILQPSLDNVIHHLQSADAWEDAAAAKEHLLFLMVGDPAAKTKADVIASVEKHIELLFFQNLFHQASGLNALERVRSLSTQCLLLKKTKTFICDIEDLTADAMLVTEQDSGVESDLGSDSDSSSGTSVLPQRCRLDKRLLASMRIECFRQIAHTEVLKKLEQWQRILHAVNQAALSVEHPYHIASRCFLEKFAHQLLGLSRDAYLHTTYEFKQIMIFLNKDCQLDSLTQEKLQKALIAWDQPLPLGRPILGNDEPGTNTPLLHTLSQGLSATLKRLTEISSDDLQTDQCLPALLDLSLTREELLALASPELTVTDAQRSAWLNMLTTISLTPFASQRCQQQARCLRQILGNPQEARDTLDKHKSVEHYLDLVSCQSFAALSILKTKHQPSRFSTEAQLRFGNHHS